MKLSDALEQYAEYLIGRDNNDDIPDGWFAILTIRVEQGNSIGAHIVDTDEEAEDDETEVGIEWVPVPSGSRVTVEYEA